MPLKPLAIGIALLALGGAVWLLIVAARHRRRWLGFLFRVVPALLLLALVASLGSYIFGFSGPHPYFNRAASVPASTVIYYLDHANDPKDQRLTLTLIAIEGQTGRTLWQRPMTGANTVAFAPGADAVYVSTSSYSSPGSVVSHIFALSAMTGAIRWQETIQDGVEDSPVLAHGALYLAVELIGPPSGYEILALRPSDGAHLWAVPIGNTPPTANLFLSATVNTLFVQRDGVGVGSGALEARRLADGGLIWSENQIGAHFILGSSAIYELHAIGPLVALSAQTGAKLWRFGGDQDVFHAGVVSGDTLFVTMQHAGPAGPGNGVITNPETVYALDAASGSLRWKFATQSQDSGELVASRDTVYIRADDGIHALRASDGAVRWHSDPHASWTFDQYSARPAVVDSTLYVTGLQILPPETLTLSEKGQNYLYAVNGADGSVDWAIAIGPVVSIYSRWW